MSAVPTRRATRLRNDAEAQAVQEARPSPTTPEAANRWGDRNEATSLRQQQQPERRQPTDSEGASEIQGFRQPFDVEYEPPEVRGSAKEVGTGLTQGAMEAMKAMLDKREEESKASLGETILSSMCQLFDADSKDTLKTAMKMRMSGTALRGALASIDTLKQRNPEKKTYEEEDPETKTTVHRMRRGVEENEEENEEEEEEERAPPRKKPKGKGDTLSMTTVVEGRRDRGRWITPKDIAKMCDETEDYDWWFAQMHEHLDACHLYEPRERVNWLVTYTEPAFLATVQERAEMEGVPTRKLRTDAETFRLFVTSRFTQVAAKEEIRSSIVSLKGRNLQPSKAWLKIRKLRYCFDQKALRDGTPTLTAREICSYFADALPRRLRMWMREHIANEHPMTQDASYALEAAKKYMSTLKEDAPTGNAKDDSEEEQETQSTMVAKKETDKERRKKTKWPTRAERRKRKRETKPEKRAGEEEKTDKPGGALAEEVLVALKSAMAQLQTDVTKKGQQQGTERLCYNCNQPGHLAAQCPHAKRQGQQQRGGFKGDRPTCTNYGKFGHPESQC